MGAPWFAGDSEDLGGVSSCREKGETNTVLAWHGTVSCAQAVMVGLLWRPELASTAGLGGSHTDVLSSKCAVQDRRCGVGDSATDLVIRQDSPHFSKKCGCRACQRQEVQSDRPAVGCGAPNPIVPATAGEGGSLSKPLWLS